MVLYRVEDKYDLPMNDYVALKERVGAVLPGDEFSSGKEGCYKISSLYFDDLNNNCYNDTVAGRILEVKYDEFIPDHILQLLEQDSMQRVAFSKYCLCRERYI